MAEVFAFSQTEPLTTVIRGVAIPAAGLRNPRILGIPRLRLGRLLVTTQVAISVVLVTGAVLMARTLANLHERVREAVWLAGAGAVAGVLAAMVGVRVIRSYLYGVAPHDPLSLIAAVALLGVVTAIAAWLPARRAARVEPMMALRCE